MLVLLSEEYELDRPTARRLCHCVCQQLCSESMVRAFLVGFLRNLNLELEDEELRQTLTRSRQPYLVDHCPIRLETFVKQYHALADDAYRDGPNSLDLNNNAVFPSSANADITRWRFFGGMRLNYNILVLTADFIATMCGDFNGGCAGDRHPTGKIADNAATQYTFSASAGFLF